MSILTFDLHLKLPFVIKIFVLSIFEWPIKTGFTVSENLTINCPASALNLHAVKRPLVHKNPNQHQLRAITLTSVVVSATPQVLKFLRHVSVKFQTNLEKAFCVQTRFGFSRNLEKVFEGLYILALGECCSGELIIYPYSLGNLQYFKY